MASWVSEAQQRSIILLYVRTEWSHLVLVSDLSIPLVSHQTIVSGP